MRPISDSSSSPISSTTLMDHNSPKSPWHSPVPYLFGGMAAMLGIIAFALLILACSYWRFSGGQIDEDRDLESGEKDKNDDAAKQPKVYEEKILVIMAGQEKPTFLATPVSTKASSFNNDKNGELLENNQEEPEEKVEIPDNEEETDQTHQQH